MKKVAGIVLIVIGALLLLGILLRVVTGNALIADSAVIGALGFCLGILAAGLILAKPTDAA